MKKNEAGLNLAPSLEHEGVGKGRPRIACAGRRGLTILFVSRPVSFAVIET